MSEWALVLVSVVEVLLTIAIFWVNTKTARIDTLEARSQQNAKDLIDARFAVIAAEFKLAVGELGAVVKQMEKRLERGDETFREDGEKWHKTELKNQSAIAELREWVMAHSATKDDLIEIAKQVGQIQNQLRREVRYE